MSIDLTADQGLLLSNFNESAVYRPDGGSVEREIEVLVDRDLPEALPEAGGPAGLAFRVTVANDATLGISASELDTGTDILEVADRPGGSLVERHITAILSQDAGMMTLEVR